MRWFGDPLSATLPVIPFNWDLGIVRFLLVFYKKLCLKNKNHLFYS